MASMLMYSMYSVVGMALFVAVSITLLYHTLYHTIRNMIVQLKGYDRTELETEAGGENNPVHV